MSMPTLNLTEDHIEAVLYQNYHSIIINTQGGSLMQEISQKVFANWDEQRKSRVLNAAQGAKDFLSGLYQEICSVLREDMVLA